MGLSNFDVTVGLIIRTTEHPEKVSAIMGVQRSPSGNLHCSYEKGMCNAEEHIWIYRTRYEVQTDVEACIKRFLSDVPEFPSRIAEVQKIGECVLRVSIVSIYAQLGFALSPDILKPLFDMNIPIEMTVLSFGNCVDE